MQEHLNLWSRREVIWQVAVSTVLMTAAFTFIFDAVQRYSSISSVPTTLGADSIFVSIFGAALTIPNFARNAILMRWAARKDFDFMHVVQRMSVVVWIASCLAYVCALVVSLLVLRPQLSSPTAIASETTLGAAIVVFRLSEMFRNIFRAEGLGLLCLESFSHGARSSPLDANRGHLLKGLRIIEQSLKRYGVVFPHERLAFAFDMLLLRGIGFDKHLGNLMRVLSDPTATDLKRAIDSCRSLLGYTKEYAEIGVQIPYSSWKRLTTSPILEFSGNIVNLLLTLIVALLALLGIRI